MESLELVGRGDATRRVSYYWHDKILGKVLSEDLLNG